MRIMSEWWERLDEARQALGWSEAELARRADIPYARINKYLNGNIDQPRGKVLQQLANAVGKSVVWIRDGDTPLESTVAAAPRRFTAAAVIGRAEAGSFREVDEFDQSERKFIDIPVDERFPRARQLVFDVSGDSMNDLKPRPILDGDRVVAVAYEDIADEYPLRDGIVVIVQRTRDGGHLREWSVKQLVITAENTQFHPRSTNPRHKPIVVSRDFQSDDGMDVEIIALVRRIMNDLPI